MNRVVSKTGFYQLRCAEAAVFAHDPGRTSQSSAALRSLLSWKLACTAGKRIGSDVVLGYVLHSLMFRYILCVSAEHNYGLAAMSKSIRFRTKRWWADDDSACLQLPFSNHRMSMASIISSLSALR